MRDEINNIDSSLNQKEINPSPSHEYESIHVAPDNPKFEEKHEFQEMGSLDYAKRIKKTSKLTSLTKTTFIAIFATCAVAFIALIKPTSNADIKFNSVLVGLNAVECSVEVSDIENSLYIDISNDFIDKLMEVTLKDDGTYVAYADNLMPNIEYDITVYDGKAKVGKTKIRTLSVNDQAIFERITYYSNVATDGKFYFTFEVNDVANKSWFNYYATLTDTSGNIASVYDILPSEANSIDITVSGLTGTTATLMIYAATLEGNKLIYSKENVSIN